MNVADPLLAGCSHSLPYKRTSRERPSFRGSQIVMSAKRIVLQKSKIERCRKCRESRFLDASTVARLCSADAQVRGQFCAKQ